MMIEGLLSEDDMDEADLTLRKSPLIPTRPEVEAYLDDLLVLVAINYTPVTVNDFGCKVALVKKATGYHLDDYDEIYAELKQDVQA